MGKAKTAGRQRTENRGLKTRVLGFYNTTLLLIFGLIVLHAPMSVWLGTTFPDYDLLIKSWKELLMLGLVPVAGYLLWQNRPVARQLVSDKLMWLVGGYGLLHLVTAVFMRDNLTSLTAGLAIDLRYILFFALVYVALKLQPELRRRFYSVGLVGAAVVLGFSLLQIFVLPRDALTGIGYGEETIMPYLTIDQNEDFVRINGTMRGPNPLGAYIVIVMSLIAAYALSAKLTRRRMAVSAFILTAPLMVLYMSHSRSAWIAAVISLLAVGFIVMAKRGVPNMKLWGAGVASLLVIAATALYTQQNSSFVQNTILHVNPESSVVSKSNVEHLASLIVGTDRMLRQPFGAGIGSTGSASLHTNSPLIVENQYLFIAHEVGWLGLALFAAIFYVVMKRLWRNSDYPLALGVFAAGIGLALIGLLLPVWVDDTVSLVWWGMAAVGISPKVIKNSRIRAS